MRRQPIVTSRRSIVPAAGFIILLLLIGVPWSGSIAIPAVLEPAQRESIYSGTPARIEAIFVTQSETIEKDQPLFRLSSPKLQSKLDQTNARIALVTIRKDRRTADAKDKADSLAIEQELASLTRQRDGLLHEIADLEIKAPFAGRVVELPIDLTVGRWIGKDDELAIVASRDRTIARGFVSERDLGRIDIATTGRFSFEDARRQPIGVAVTSLAFWGSPSIDIAELASTAGGPIAVEEDREHKLVPTVGAYAVTLSTELPAGELSRITRGLIHLDGTRESFLAAAWRQILKVLICESGA